MAEVFAARLRGPAGFEKLVAVKRLLPDLNDDHFVTMFLDEARLAAHITSPHVVQTLELGRAEDDGALYIVMELVVGVTLYDLCVSIFDSTMGKTPINHVAEICAQAARGLDDAHNATTPTGQSLQVVHRDVSPQNILVGLDGRVRVTDFGIARAVSRSTQTQVGQLKGKVAYLSPEQSRGESLDKRSDVFSLGVVTWEALTGRSLFNTGDPIETVKRVRDLRIPDPRELRADVPEPLARVVLWALERDADRRCPSASRYARALREAVPDRPGALEIGTLVRERGGKTLAEFQTRMNQVSQSETLVHHTGGVRIIPEAAPPMEGSKLFPLSRANIQNPGTKKPAEPARKKQRDVSTSVVPHDDPTQDPVKPPKPKPRGESKPVPKAWVIVGVVAWVIAGALLIYAFSGGGGSGTTLP